ncbi:MAG TPA: cupredoxin domain-containing protein [Flavisolibacter sp.]|nr:cupredoxin domain-containing protein [Flavisolibacter sp.]
MKTTVIKIGKVTGICLFFSIFFLIGCGAPEDFAIPPATQDGNLKINQDTVNTDQTTQTTDQASAKKGAHIFTVYIKTMAFNPAQVKVHKGDMVIWNNQDMVVHCVTEDPGKGWTSSEIPPGGSWKMVVTKSTNYYCAIHLIMKGKIVVE